MTFVPRTRVEIRDAILANMQARYREKGIDLLTIPGSDAYMMADTYALELQSLENQAQRTRLDILPDVCSEETLDRHANVLGLSRKTATKARIVVRCPCVVSAAISLTNRTVKSVANAYYTPEISAVTDSDNDGFVDIPFTAQTPGIESNLPINAVVQWDVTPINITATTGTVTSINTTGQDIESIARYRRRIVDRMRERPGGGNRSDWRDWVETVSGVESAFVVPLLNGKANIASGPLLGCVTVFAMGPPQGDSVTNTRILSNTKLQEIKDYILGTKDANGNVVIDGVQLNPVTVSASNFFIEAPNTQVLNVKLSLVLSAGYKNVTVLSQPQVSSTTTTMVVSGDRTSYLNQFARVHVGTAFYRGGYAIRKISAAIFSAGNTTLTFDTPLLAAPSNDADSLAIYPSPTNDNALRLAVFAYFDSLGVSVYNTLFERYPNEEFANGNVTYLGKLLDAIIPTRDENGKLANGVEGTVSARTITPSIDATVTAGSVMVLGTLTILQE